MDALERAQALCHWMEGNGGFKAGDVLPREWVATKANTAALIAIAERLDTQNEHLAYIRGNLNVVASILNDGLPRDEIARLLASGRLAPPARIGQGE